MLQLFKIPEWFIWTSFIATFLATLWKGGWEARVVAGLELGQVVYLRAWILIFGHRLGGVNDEAVWPYLIQDLVMAVILIACAAKGRRYWVLWAASLGLDFLAIDVMMVLSAPVSPWAYKWASYLLSYATVGLALWDVWLNVREGRTGARLGVVTTVS